MQVPDNVVSGTVECISGRTRLPDIPCRLVYIQADPLNSVDITFGGITVDSESEGLVLEPGEKLPSMLVDNLNRFYVYSQSEAYIHYLVIR